MNNHQITELLKISMANTILFLSVNSSYSHSSLALPILHNACKGLTNWQWLKEEITIQEDPGDMIVRLQFRW